MKYFQLVILLLFTGLSVHSQQYTWSGTVSHLIYENCSSCHNNSGIAPFPLMSYEDAVEWAGSIDHAVTEREMPPWPADPNYMHFANEAYLEEAEIEALQWWAQNNTPLGNIDDVPDAPVFAENGSLLESIDYTIEMEPYTLQSNTDEFRYFAFENPFNYDIYINKLEVIAGNQSVVHHADLWYDLSGNSLNTDNLDPLSGFNSSTGSPSLTSYINAWQPGGNIAEYPENWGFRVPAGADFVFEIHYAPDQMGETDQTRMNLQFIPSPDNPRQLTASWLMGHTAPTLIDGPLFIPADEERIFHQITAPLQNDISVVSICPHMHFIGSSYKVWYTDPDGIDHPLIDIPRWDLHWQKYYVFQTVKHIPAGSILKSEGVYDNTLNNHDNPFDPPQDVGLGSGTFDEMFLCYFIYSNYQIGDEDIIMDPDLITGTEELELERSRKDYLDIYPSPAAQEINFLFDFNANVDFKLSIKNTSGEIVYESYGNTSESSFKIDVNHLSSGMYILFVNDEKSVRTSKFFKI